MYFDIKLTIAKTPKDPPKKTFLNVQCKNKSNGGKKSLRKTSIFIF